MYQIISTPAFVAAFLSSFLYIRIAMSNYAAEAGTLAVIMTIIGGLAVGMIAGMWASGISIARSKQNPDSKQPFQE